jgi:hypothetical protein
MNLGPIELTEYGDNADFQALRRKFPIVGNREFIWEKREDY